MANIPIYCGPEAIAGLIRYCQSRGLGSFLLVNDRNTYAALGQRVEASLREPGWDVRTVVLGGTVGAVRVGAVREPPEVVADERHVFEVLYQARGEARAYLAVGSGTITDITRYASFCARNPFISLPTAPSVDGYASAGAALVIDGFKLTVPGQSPTAIFADLPTLCRAPRDMIAAGFGDMLGKYTALADWKLGALLLDEAYSAELARRMERALQRCAAQAGEIGRASAAGIETLMAGLIESGLCMREFGSSRPASGSEHLYSHFWEMRRMQEGRAALLHGIKVGVGTLLAARHYEALRGLAQEELTARLAAASPPDREAEIARIRATYGAAGERIVAGYEPFLERIEAGFETLKQRVGARWGEIQEIAADVPAARRIADLLEQAGGPGDPRAIGLEEDEVRQALQFSCYLRGRFGVDTLGRLLGMW